MVRITTLTNEKLYYQIKLTKEVDQRKGLFAPLALLPPLPQVVELSYPLSLVSTKPFLSCPFASWGIARRKFWLQVNNGCHSICHSCQKGGGSEVHQFQTLIIDKLGKLLAIHSSDSIYIGCCS